MAITQKKDGRWCVYYRDPKTGRQKWEYFGHGIEGEKNARQRNDELGFRKWKQRTPKKSSPLFFELVNAYIQSKAGTSERTTKVNLLYKMNGVILPELGQTPAIRITPNRLDQYVAKRLNAPRTTTIHYGPGKQFSKKITVTDPDGQPLRIKRTTVNRELSDIIAVLSWAADPKQGGYLTHNPAAGYKKPKRDDEIIAPPTANQIRKLLKASPPHLARALITSYYTGIRPGQVELLSIKWTDVDFDDKLLFVRSARKGGLKFRRIPIHKQFLKNLRQWKNLDKKNGMPEHIINYRGKPIKRIIKAFNSAKKKAGITRRLRPYDFRHAAISMMLNSGADLKSASAIAGHTRTETTTKIYQHINMSLKRDAIDLLQPLDFE